MFGNIFSSTSFKNDRHDDLLLPQIKVGYLLMETQGGNKWKRYAIALVGTNLKNIVLYYSDVPRITSSSSSLPGEGWSIPLFGAHVDRLEEMIMIMTTEETWFLCAEDEREAQDWVDVLTSSLDSARRTGKIPFPRRRGLRFQISKATIAEIQTRDINTRVYEFQEMFLCADENHRRQEAANGELTWSCLRSICWKIWLGYFTKEKTLAEWIILNNEQRDQYQRLEVRYPLEDHELNRFLELNQIEEDEREQVNLDGSSSTDSVLLQSIIKDVKRTHASMDFFREIKNQKMLIRILYRWSRFHASISYHQGMNELLAVVMYLLVVEQWPGEENGDDDDRDSTSLHTDESTRAKFHDALQVLVFSQQEVPAAAMKYFLHNMTHPDYIEHEAFIFFDLIMIRMSEKFCPTRHPHHARQDYYTSMMDTTFEDSSLNAQLENIHNHILQRIDPVLWKHCQSIGLYGQTYLLRWVRLLLSREFRMYDVWGIWDCIFSLTPDDFTFMDYFCVAAIRNFRVSILQEHDLPSILLCVRDLGQKIHVQDLVKEARKLYEHVLVATAFESTDGAK